MNSEQSRLTKSGEFLQKSLAGIEAYDRREPTNESTNTLHVSNVGSTFITSYEQLRSVAENIEDNMLTQSAILRFYRRNIVMTKARHKLGRELVIELTQAGYLKNDSTPNEVIKDLDILIASYASLREKLASSAVPASTYDRWILDLLSVQTEQLLNNPIRILSFVHFAHNFFTETVDYSRIISTMDGIEKEDLPKLLYSAIHKELLKSNDANARSGLFQLYRMTPVDVDQFVTFNKRFDEYNGHKAANELLRFVANNGAPLHVIRQSYFEMLDDTKSAPVISQPYKTEAFIGSHIDRIYKKTKQTVNHGMIKSTMFLLLAYVVVGLLIEIPYELIVTGGVQLMPLAINLILPILFLIIGVVTYKKPSDLNKQALQRYIRSMLHVEDKPTIVALKYPNKQKKNYAFEILFGMTFALAFYMVIPRLVSLDYTIPEAGLFLFLFSVANFLGYRLTLHYKDIEHVSTDQGFASMVRNFIYLPFIFIGKWIVKRSEKFNIVARILDVAIDLPLKTIVRLIRQWLGFLQGKKDTMM